MNKSPDVYTVLGLKLRIVLCFFLAFLSLLVAARVGLLKVASNYFADLPSKQVLLSFLVGLRFDFYVICLCVMPLFVLILLPFTRKIFIKILAVVLCVEWVCMAIYLVADIIFFSSFNNHIGVEFFTAFTHVGLFAQLALQTYWFITFPLLLLVGVVAWGLCRYCERFVCVTPKKFMRNSVILIVIFALVCFLGIRGRMSFHGKPFGIMDSQVLGSQQTSDLILNGVFTLLNAIKTNEHREVFFEQDKRPFVIATRSEKIVDPQYPFERVRTSFSYPNKGYNFVIILLESFDPIILQQYPDAAVHLTEIKNNSLYFTNFYSVANRSLIGVTAVLFSLPHVWGLPSFTQGLGGKNLSRIAQYFNHKGYTTINLITDIATSDKAIEMAHYAGFDQFYSKEDIPVRHKYPAFNKGFDYEGFEFFLDKLNQVKGNFFAYMFTSSTHGPYNILLSKEHMKYPHDTEEHQFLNRVAYTDAALGNFFAQARKTDWFKNTIFFILPDHRTVFVNKQQTDDKAKQNYASFLLVYAPALFAPKEIDTIATQEDLLPTLLDLLNSKEKFSAVGQSLFDKDRKSVRYIYSENKDIYILDADKGNHHFKFWDKIDDLSDEEKEAIRFNEALYDGLKANTFKQK